MDHYGGIESAKVFELLRLYDEKSPLSEADKNPFLKAMQKASFVKEFDDDGSTRKVC